MLHVDCFLGGCHIKGVNMANATGNLCYCLRCFCVLVLVVVAITDLVLLLLPFYHHFCYWLPFVLSCKAIDQCNCWLTELVDCLGSKEKGSPFVLDNKYLIPGRFKSISIVRACSLTWGAKCPYFVWLVTTLVFTAQSLWHTCQQLFQLILLDCYSTFASGGCNQFCLLDLVHLPVFVAIEFANHSGTFASSGFNRVFCMISVAATSFLKSNLDFSQIWFDFLELLAEMFHFVVVQCN